MSLSTILPAAALETIVGRHLNLELPPLEFGTLGI